MKLIEFKNAYYIKLGKGGIWEKSSISENKARIGWNFLTVDEINGKDWKTLATKLKSKVNYGSKGAATTDINALKTFVNSTPEDIWITFYSGQLWRCRLGDNIVYEDEKSRFRTLSEEWNNRDIDGKLLLTNHIPGSIAKTQRFQGTICKVNEESGLKRLINNQPSEKYQAVLKAKNLLVNEVQKSFTQLHWKDFEILVDLVFRNAGWNRTSVIGESMKYSDIELEEPITGEMYQVQVKAEASLDEYLEYARGFSPEIYKRQYFVVHSPDTELLTHKPEEDGVELILPERLASMVVEFGLVGWLLMKIK